MEIKSVSNETIKFLRKAFTHRKVAKEEGIFFLSGINLYYEVVNSGINYRYILYAPSQLLLRGEKELLDELNTLEQAYPEKIIRVSKVILGKFSPIAEDQGVLVVAERFIFSLDQVMQQKGIFFLYNVQDPGNVGTIIRLAEGNEFGVILTQDSASPFNEKTVRASMGSVLRVPFYISSNPIGELTKLRENGFCLVATDPRVEKNFFEIPLDKKITFILGNEGQGIPDEIRDFADLKVKIPMKGEVESYNVAVSAAMLTVPILMNEKGD